MKNELVVYKNDFNQIPLKSFKSVELDLLFSIMSQMRNKGLTSVTLTFEQLKSLSKYNNSNAIKEFVKDLESTYDKLIHLDVKIGDDRKFTKFVFFTEYTIDIDKQTVTICVNERFSHLINELTGSFTKLELDEVTSLSSSYSKNGYRLLKQYRSTGYATFWLDEFKELMDVPESYNYGNINLRVLKPIEKELPKYFPNLKINRIKGKGKDKRKVVRLEFKFKNDDGLNKGNRTFRAEDGTYYEKYISDFTEEEIKKAYPETNKKD
jgi:plasmid replication initiation protein